MRTLFRVGYESEDLRDRAQALADKIHGVVEKNASNCLFVSSSCIYLKMHGFSPLSADFSTSTWARRKSDGKKQGLVRACKPGRALKIIDATAGWGRDAAILASFGAQVLMIERNPVMAALLDDALQLRTDKEMNLSLCTQDAYLFLKNLPLEEYPDVIYIDPMHPARSKSALVKKEMQALQELIGADEDAQALIELAITRVKQRVVVKWPQKTPALIPTKSSVEGKTVRFDIYG